MSVIKKFSGSNISVKVTHNLNNKYNHVTVYVGDTVHIPVGVYPIDKNSLQVVFGAAHSDITVVVG